MIANKLIPSFFILDVRGSAVKSIIPGDFGISKLIIGSKPFDSDLQATASLKDSIYAITNKLDWDNSELKTEFNPEFFPTLAPKNLTEEQLRAIEVLSEYEDGITETLEENKLAVAMPTLFDPLGDYVESRWICKADEFEILGRIAVDPDTFIQHRIDSKLAKIDSSKQLTSSPLTLH